MEKSNKKGVALISVIVMIVLLSSLIIAVVLTATISIRRANYYNDKLFAYELAERGIQEILNRLNYYGYRENDGGSEWTRASWIGFNLQNSTISIPQWYENEILSKGFSLSDLSKYETSILFPEIGKNAKSTIYFIDINSSTKDETDLDLIISKGNYNGRTAEIGFKLRGAGEIREYSSHFWYGDFNVKNSNRTKGNPGITEAFNKHVIYTSQINGISTNVKGNITFQNPPKPSLTNVTFTETYISLPNLTNINIISLPNRPNSFTENYDNSGNCNGNPVPPPTGVSFSGGTYTFSTGYVQSGPVKIDGANARLTGGITINNYFYVTGGNITIDGNVSLVNDACFETDNISITNNSIINGNIRIKCSSNTNLNTRFTLYGSLIWEGGQLTISGTNITIGGSLVINGNNLIIQNTATNLNINASTSNKEGGIFVYNGNLTINSSPTITIGNNQLCGILVYADTGNRNVSLNSSPNFIFPPDKTNQLAIIGYNTGGSVNITVNGNIPRGIFSKGNNNTGNITLNSGTITGSLIANGTVTLNGGTLTYDPNPFKNNSEVYKGFVGGRRKYIPVPGSWRIEW